MNNLTLLSKYRSVLMGIAILWVIIFHSDLGFSIDCIPIRFIFLSGFGGVDIFFFLSSFGLYYASQKKEPLFQFYFNRFIRIIPAFVFIVFVDSLFSADFNVFNLPKSFFDLELWKSASVKYWFVSFICLFYLFFPLYLKIFNKSPYLTTGLSIIFTFLLIFISFKYFRPGISLLFFTRIPILSLGVLFAMLSQKANLPSENINYVCLVSLLIGLVILYLYIFIYPIQALFGGQWLVFVLIVPSFSVLLTSLLDKVKMDNKLLLPLTFLGGISLELYLMHVCLFSRMQVWSDYFNVNFIVMTIIVILLSIFLSFLLSKVTNKIAISSKTYIQNLLAQK